MAAAPHCTLRGEPGMYLVPAYLFLSLKEKIWVDKEFEYPSTHCTLRDGIRSAIFLFDF